MAMAVVDVKYNDQLFTKIKNLFIDRIVPENFLYVIHKYAPEVLTNDDIQRIQKRLETKASKEVNYHLLETMKNYKGWFEAIIDVCKDRDVKQDFLVDEFIRLRGELDKNWPSCQTQKKELGFSPGSLPRVSRDAPKANAGNGCVPSKSMQRETEKTKQPPKAHQDMAEHTFSYEELEMKNGKVHCNVCDIYLSSDKLSDTHVKGKPHQNHLKERINISFGESQTDNARVASSEPTSGSNKAGAPSSKPAPGSKKAGAASSKPAPSSNKATASSSKPAPSSNKAGTASCKPAPSSNKARAASSKPAPSSNKV